MINLIQYICRSITIIIIWIYSDFEQVGTIETIDLLKYKINQKKALSKSRLSSKLYFSKTKLKSNRL